MQAFESRTEKKLQTTCFMCLFKQPYGYSWAGGAFRNVCACRCEGEPCYPTSGTSVSLYIKQGPVSMDLLYASWKRLGNNYFRIELEFMKMFFEWIILELRLLLLFYFLFLRHTDVCFWLARAASGSLSTLWIIEFRISASGSECVYLPRDSFVYSKCYL